MRRHVELRTLSFLSLLAGNVFWRQNAKTGKPQLVYLDCGLAVELNAADAANFADCVYAIVHGKPEDAGRYRLYSLYSRFYKP